MSERVDQDDGTPRVSSRLERRLSALESIPRQAEPISVLRLLNTEELRLALALIERARVLPNGDVGDPEAFREATPEELEALEHWRQLYGEPLDHLELAEELLDRVGEAHGWRSPEALETALFLKRLELPHESPWFVGKSAEALVVLYAEMEEHGVGRGGASLHPHLRAAVRRLERLKEMYRLAPETQAPPETEGPLEAVEQESPKSTSNTEDSHTTPEHQSAEEQPAEEQPAEEQPAEEQPQRRRSWWREYFGFD
jgi:hypothetical protein